MNDSAPEGGPGFHVALWEPEIPANTGNIGRLCLAAGAALHLVGQPGFRLDDRTVRRAGIDHWRHVNVVEHATLADFEGRFAHQAANDRLFCLSARASVPYTRVRYQPGDVFLFGRESSGLPPEVVARYEERALFIPMPGGKTRSLNLANAVSIILYEALRQVYGW